MQAEEKKKIAHDLYKNEGVIWANLTNQYYRPQGAPGRLSYELLRQWHDKNKTGARDPATIGGCLVRVSISDNSYIVKRFVTKTSAENYIKSLLRYDIPAKIMDSIREAYNFEQ